MLEVADYCYDFYDKLLANLKENDTSNLFCQPVKEKDAPNYYEKVTCPMDFSTLERNVRNGEYLSMDGFRHDFELICKNAIEYYTKDTEHYIKAKELLEHGNAVFKNINTSSEMGKFAFGEQLSDGRNQTDILDEQTRHDIESTSPFESDDLKQEADLPERINQEVNADNNLVDTNAEQNIFNTHLNHSHNEKVVSLKKVLETFEEKLNDVISTSYSDLLEGVNEGLKNLFNVTMFNGKTLEENINKEIIALKTQLIDDNVEYCSHSGIEFQSPNNKSPDVLPHHEQENSNLDNPMKYEDRPIAQSPNPMVVIPALTTSVVLQCEDSFTESNKVARENSLQTTVPSETNESIPFTAPCTKENSESVNPKEQEKHCDDTTLSSVDTSLDFVEKRACLRSINNIIGTAAESNHINSKVDSLVESKQKKNTINIVMNGHKQVKSNSSTKSSTLPKAHKCRDCNYKANDIFLLMSHEKALHNVSNLNVSDSPPSNSNTSKSTRDESNQATEKNKKEPVQKQSNEVLESVGSKLGNSWDNSVLNSTSNRRGENIVPIADGSLKPVFKCTVCLFSTTDEKYLINHNASEHYKVRHNCQQCEFASMDEASLVKHMMAMHENVKLYKCFKCEYSAGYKEYIRMHMDTVHGNTASVLQDNYAKNDYRYPYHKKKTISRAIKLPKPLPTDLINEGGSKRVRNIDVVNRDFSDDGNIQSSKRTSNRVHTLREKRNI